MTIALCIALAIVAVSILIWLSESTEMKRVINRMPGPPALPLFGNALEFKPDGSDWYAQIDGFARLYGQPLGLLRMWLASRAYVLLIRAETTEVLLNSSKHNEKSADYDFLHPWLRRGLLTSTGEKWKSRRRLLTPTFHFRILHDFVQIFNEQARIMTHKLEEERLAGDTFDIFPYVTHCALDIICESAMGKTANAQQHSDSEYVKAIYEISELINHRQRKPWLWSDLLYNWCFEAGKRHRHCLRVLHSFTEQVIHERAELLSPLIADLRDSELDFADALGGRRRLAFLDMLLFESQRGAALDFLDIREEVDTFMFEGHDTTAAAVNWAVHLIGADADVQRRVHAELDDIFGDSDRHITMDDLKKLKYLECCIKEALRLFPSVPFFARRLSENAHIAGYDVPRGTTAIVLTAQLHRDERYFPDAERFDPERWRLENVVGRHPYAYVPFSAGARNCIGQRFAMNEEKVLLANLFRRFRIESMQTRDELKPVAELITRPANGIHVRLYDR